MKKKAEETVAERWIIARKGEGKEFKVLVPAGGHVTFGPAIPGPASARQQYGSSEYALRLYGSKGPKDLRAVFTGIREFRDMDIPHYQAVTREAGKTLWKSDEKGFEVTTSAQREKSWSETALLQGYRHGGKEKEGHEDF